ncbi:hypothetical protein [Niabella sp.]|uniref:hypothetical protein n=1 Tax=Niabella sp. TaxID=1962976 RepID=UPI002604A1E3|nr:hypothetical protein [Niabella sp.]
MKRILSFLMVAVYLNAALLPQVAERDLFDATGVQRDDVNSIAEWIGITLGIDKTPDDEDNDFARNFIAVKAIKLSNLAQYADSGIRPVPARTAAIKHPGATGTHNLPVITIDILSPPPEGGIAVHAFEKDGYL